MEGVIIDYRGSHKTQHPMNQMIIKVETIDSKEQAGSLLKKAIVWTSPAGKEIHGVILKEHGNKGAVRVKFEKGLPGQAIGTKVKLK
nr:50S ribosomal protein L35ae [Nanoarchaeum sp.]